MLFKIISIISKINRLLDFSANYKNNPGNSIQFRIDTPTQTLKTLHIGDAKLDKSRSFKHFKKLIRIYVNQIAL